MLMKILVYLFFFEMETCVPLQYFVEESILVAYCGFGFVTFFVSVFFHFKAD